MITYPQQLDLRVRPIVGRPKCLTHKLSNFIDILLKSFLKDIPRCIKDGLDSLKRFQRETEHDTIIAVIDVVSL